MYQWHSLGSMLLSFDAILQIQPALEVCLSEMLNTELKQTNQFFNILILTLSQIHVQQHFILEFIWMCFFIRDVSI